MHLLLVAHRDVRMFREKIMQRRRPRFLCTCQNEIESLDLSPLLKHLLQVIQERAISDSPLPSLRGDRSLANYLPHSCRAVVSVLCCAMFIAFSCPRKIGLIIITSVFGLAI